MENLKKIREKRNFTQIKLSVDLGIAQETISGYEIGKSYPSVDILIKLANALNTSTDYLLGRIESDKPLNLTKSDLTDDECDLIQLYKDLSNENKHKLLGFAEALKE